MYRLFHLKFSNAKYYLVRFVSQPPCIAVDSIQLPFNCKDHEQFWLNPYFFSRRQT